jgi:16S rRNA (uracil1498-N3)-methyltransferase
MCLYFFSKIIYLWQAKIVRFTNNQSLTAEIRKIMHLFYSKSPVTDTFILDEEESKHCTRVLRLSEGDTISLVDGVGGFYEARIYDANPKRCRVEIISSQFDFGKRNFHLTIAIAPTKNIERLEWFLEKATEIGIEEIVPLYSKHSERRTIKPERLEKVITSAMKQSLKAYHPILHQEIEFDKFVIQAFDGQKFIAHCIPGYKPLLKDIYRKDGNVLILIGPEGDFSPEEVDLALNNGFEAISLGNSRLRTETAGVVACHTINLLNQIGG